jgi:drug/metabolite transporter (DMT)-like permease
MAVAVLGISLSAPLTTLLAAPMLALAFWRNLGGAAVLLPVLLLRERSVLAGLRPRELTSSVVAGLFLAAHFAAWLPSLSMTTVAASTALVTTTPVWTALAARASGVRLPAATWWGPGARGARRRADRRGGRHGQPARAGRRRAGAAGRDLRRRLRAGRRPGPAAAVDLGVRGGLLLGVRRGDRGRRRPGRQPADRLPRADWLLIAAITVCAQLLGHTLFNLLLSSVGPTMVSLVILLEVPGALLFALVLLQQVPPLLALPGVALVVVGVGLVVRASRPAGLAEPGT